MNSQLITLSPQQLRKAADIQERIGRLQTELGRVLGASTQTHLAAARPGKRTMSLAARARIAAAARARWAKIKGKKRSAPAGKKPRRKMSAAARARLAAIARERWRKAKAQGKKAL